MRTVLRGSTVPQVAELVERDGAGGEDQSHGAASGRFAASGPALPAASAASLLLRQDMAGELCIAAEQRDHVFVADVARLGIKGAKRSEKAAVIEIDRE